MANGPISSGLLVCHRCDTPACVNPEHLFLGTHADNTGDMMAKGRGRRPIARCGEASPSAKLNAVTAGVVRFLARNTTLTNKTIASMFGIQRTHVSNIRLGRVWADAPRPLAGFA
jgi:hypothetical protein